MERDLKRNIDEMLEVMYGQTEAPPKTLASVNAMFSHIQELGGEIRSNKRPRRTTLTRDRRTQDAMYLD